MCSVCFWLPSEHARLKLKDHGLQPCTFLVGALVIRAIRPQDHQRSNMYICTERVRCYRSYKSASQRTVPLRLRPLGAPSESSHPSAAKEGSSIGSKEQQPKEKFNAVSGLGLQGIQLLAMARPRFPVISYIIKYSGSILARQNRRP